MKKKQLSILIFIFTLLLVFTGVTYSLFNLNKIGLRNSELIAGEVYMHYNQSNNLIIQNVRPINTYDPNNYFEFTIDGKNTVPDKDIYYEIVLNHGDNHNTRSERIRDDLLKFRLVEVISNQEIELVNNLSFNDLTNKKIWVDTINRNITEEITRTYRLYMWISDKVRVCDGNITNGCDYYYDQDPSWDNVYASINITVSGDFTEKTLPYNYLAKKNYNTYNFWPSSLESVKANIIEINFIDLTESQINQRYQAASIKEDVTDTTKGGQVLAWLEVDDLDNTKYKMYVASVGTTYFPANCTTMFSSFSNLKTINFENIDTSQVTSMYSMFNNCSSLTSLDVSNFDTSQVTSMFSMFSGCSALTSLDLSNFDTSKVTNMRYMFSNCNSLTSLDLSNFDTSKVTNMEYMFSACSALTSLDVSKFDTSQVTAMNGMFYNCNSLTSLDVSNFNTSQVKAMDGMFFYCSSLINLDLSSFDTSKVTYMGEYEVRKYGMFEGCSSLTSLDISGFNLSNSNQVLTDWRGMFYSVSTTCQVLVRDSNAQTWILNLSSLSRPSAWSTSNVIIKN